MNKKKIASLLLLASIVSQITFSSITSVHAIEIPTSIENTLNEQVDKIMNELSKNNVAAEREEVKNVLFGRTMPIQKTEEIIKKVVSLGLNNAPGIAGTFGGKIGQPLMDMLWPYSNPNYLWEKIRVEVEKIVGNKIADSRFQQVKNKLSGLKKATQEYISWIEDANDGKDVTDSMKNKLDSLDSLFTSELVQIGDVQNKVYDVEFLPIYTQAANLHLMLLRDAVLNLQRTSHTEDEINHYKTKLKNKIQEYTNYCKTVYQKAIRRRDQQSSTAYPDDRNYRMNYGQVTPANRKSYVIQMETFMQTYVLDYVALWAYMDSQQYNKNVDMEVSREIYSKIYGFQEGVKHRSRINFSRKDYTQGDYLGEFTGADVWSYSRIDAITPLYKREGSDDYFPYSRIGGSGGKYDYFRIRNPKENPIKSVDIYARETPQAMRFNYKNGNKFDSGLYVYPTYVNQPIYAEKVQFEGHKLSGVYALGRSYIPGLEGLSGLVFGFRPENLTPENNLKEGKISVFSSQKYINRDSFTTQREFLLGGNAMKTNTKDANMTYKFNSPNEGLYRVRYKVAAKTNSIISLSNAGQKIKDTTVSKTTDGILGNYDTPYKVVDGPVVKLKNGKNDIKIANANGGEFSISNIEFVPVTNEEVKELTPIKNVFDFNKNLDVSHPTEANINAIKKSQSVSFVDFNDKNQFVTYKIEAPKAGIYDLKINDNVNQLSKFKVLNLENNKYNDGNKIELQKGENKIKFIPKELNEENLCSLQGIEVTGASRYNKETKFTSIFSNGNEFRRQGNKMILENVGSYIDFKVGFNSGFEQVNVKINGDGEFNIINVPFNEYATGPNNYISLSRHRGETNNIIRISPKYLISKVNIKKHDETMIGYN